MNYKIYVCTDIQCEKSEFFIISTFFRSGYRHVMITEYSSTRFFHFVSLFKPIVVFCAFY